MVNHKINVVYVSSGIEKTHTIIIIIHIYIALFFEIIPQAYYMHRTILLNIICIVYSKNTIFLRNEVNHNIHTSFIIIKCYTL